LRRAVLRSSYLPPPRLTRGFWTRERILSIRRAAEEGLEPRIVPGPSRRGRILDRLYFPDIRPGAAEELARRLGPGGVDRLDVDLSVGVGGFRLEMPVYLGDMSFGALSGTPNIVLARAADIVGVLVGAGEGGLHPEVAKCRNVAVQWASGRFGVSVEMLSRGLAVVIKIGQGAKPGIGGHLPGSKVVGEIARLRRLPEGTEALSPAPHHDIYSIEDLAQRIRMLGLLTGKPVLVKVAATHQVGYVAAGVARGGAAGVIIDGAGAGTGAAPVVVRDNVGIPVDYAVPAADSMLRANGLRGGFTLIGGGMVSCGADIVKLVALGADMAVMATAALIAMGCIMCHQCSRGRCPAGLTSSITHPVGVDPDWALSRLVSWLRAVGRSLKLITYLLGEDRLSRLRGARGRILRATVLDSEASRLTGVEADEEGPIAWYGEPRYTLREEAYMEAKTPVEGGGGIVPGYTVPAERPLDLLRIEAAQVTRPPVDPYREEVSTRVTVPAGVFEAPIATPCIDPALEAAAEGLGYPLECMHGGEVVEPGERPPVLEGMVMVREEAFDPASTWLEEWVSWIDREAWRRGVRGSLGLMASGDLRDGADVYKLAALGADIVCPRRPFTLLRERLGGLDYGLRRERYENLLVELTWELKLLMGAGGLTGMESLVGNRSLLRSLDGQVASRLGGGFAGF